MFWQGFLSLPIMFDKKLNSKILKGKNENKSLWQYGFESVEGTK